MDNQWSDGRSKVGYKAITLMLNENQHRGQADWETTRRTAFSGWFSARAGCWLNVTEAVGLFMYYATPETERIGVSMSSFD